MYTCAEAFFVCALCMACTLGLTILRVFYQRVPCTLRLTRVSIDFLFVRLYILFYFCTIYFVFFFGKEQFILFENSIFCFF